MEIAMINHITSDEGLESGGVAWWQSEDATLTKERNTVAGVWCMETRSISVAGFFKHLLIL